MAQWHEDTSWWSVSYLYHCTRAVPRKKPHLNLLFPNSGPITLIGCLPSCFTHLQSVQLLSHFQHPKDLEKKCHIFIQLVTAIVLHPHETLLCPLSDLWLSLCVKFVPYMNCAFCLDSDPAMSWRGESTRAETKQRNMTAEHAYSCLCDELKRSVDESGRFDEATQIVS